MILDYIYEQIKKEKAYLLTKPNLAILNLTYRCNLSCKSCRLPSNVDNKRKELTTEEIKKIVDDIEDMNIRDIRIVDSEALLRGDILEIVNYIKKKSMELHLVTNGILLDEKISKSFIESKLDRLSISLDGANESTHDSNRGKGMFDRTMRNVKLLLKLKRERNIGFPNVHFLSLISSLNFKNLEEFEDLRKEINADQLSFSYLSETPINLYNNTIFNGKRIASNRFIPKNQSLLLEENELKVLRSTIKDLDINSLKIIKSLKDEHIVEGKFPVKKCYHTRDSITIDPYGDVIPCSVIKNYSYGNVRGKSIKEIWKNKNHEKFKKRLNKNFFPICSSCCHFPDNLTFGQNIKLFFGLKL